jgi:hypothetical protein
MVDAAIDAPFFYIAFRFINYIFPKDDSGVLPPEGKQPSREMKPLSPEEEQLILEIKRCHNVHQICVKGKTFAQVMEVVNELVQYLIQHDELPESAIHYLCFVMNDDQSETDQLMIAIMRDGNTVRMEIKLSFCDNVDIHSERFATFLSKFRLGKSERSDNDGYSFEVIDLVFNVPGLKLASKIVLDGLKYIRWCRLIIRGYGVDIDGTSKGRAILEGNLSMDEAYYGPNDARLSVENFDLRDVFFVYGCKWWEISFVNCSGGFSVDGGSLSSYFPRSHHRLKMEGGRIDYISIRGCVNSYSYFDFRGYKGDILLEERYPNSKNGKVFINCDILCDIHERPMQNIEAPKGKFRVRNTIKEISIQGHSKSPTRQLTIDKAFFRKFCVWNDLDQAFTDDTPYEGKFDISSARVICRRENFPISRFSFRGCSIKFIGMDLRDLSEELSGLERMDNCSIIFSKCDVAGDFRRINSSETKKIVFDECKFLEGVRIDLCRFRLIKFINCKKINFENMELYLSQKIEKTCKIVFSYCNLINGMTEERISSIQGNSIWRNDGSHLFPADQWAVSLRTKKCFIESSVRRMFNGAQLLTWRNDDDN